MTSASISGLLLAPQPRQLNILREIFERDNDFEMRVVGWGLTWHWPLPALRQL